MNIKTLMPPEWLRTRTKKPNQVVSFHKPKSHFWCFCRWNPSWSESGNGTLSSSAWGRRPARSSTCLSPRKCSHASPPTWTTSAWTMRCFAKKTPDVTWGPGGMLDSKRGERRAINVDHICIMYIYICIYTHAHTHIYIYRYRYIDI